MSIDRSRKKSLVSSTASLIAIVVVFAHFVEVSAQDLTADVSDSEQDNFDKAYKQLEESMNVLGMNSDQFQKTDMAKQLQAALTPVFTVPFIISLSGNVILLILSTVLLIFVLKLGGQKRKKKAVNV